MIHLDCDYSEGCHPRVLEALGQSNLQQTVGYGLDPYCVKAAELIKQLCQQPQAQVHFFVGGTQTNSTVIASCLRPHQGVICAQSGHINVHESGAIENCGHKVLPLPSSDGKLSEQQVRQACWEYWNDETREHMVQPAMLYISQPSELGSLYSFSELRQLQAVCQEFHLLLYVDGARLGCALAALEGQLSLAELASSCDMFYIGLTKMGALFGEALVIKDAHLGRDFRSIMKQQGSLLAKGRLLGLQALTLFQDGLYLQLARHANAMARDLEAILRAKGYQFLLESQTNQIFPIIPDSSLSVIAKNFVYSYWTRHDSQHSAVRFCTSWATSPEQLARFSETLEGL